ncbi:uncharacterized protein C5orf49 [Austrofundulus limnaeus]|uniref:Uncharacterized protein C5orf49 n=1 Tax=Austrofundulus limnaeus TaxID=52670 RepID=A0A2I4B4P8_AUSLI|nr:PREDICTED: uncharacterized protein C5orf49 homolog [Austrofundulus limnaeus]
MTDLSLDTQNKPLCVLSAFSYIPTRRTEAKEMSYFNRDPKVTDVTTYDQVFHQAEGYDIKLKQDNRKHWKGRGLDIYQEEKARPVPVRSSSEYGHRVVPSFNQTNQSYARVATMKAEFYMKDGIIWSLEEGYGSVVPS